MQGFRPHGRCSLLLLLAVCLLLALQRACVAGPSSDVDAAERRLRKIFEEALQENEDFQLPDWLQSMQGMSLKDKAQALAEYALQHSDENLKQWLGEASPYIQDIKKALTEKNKVSRAKAVKSALTSLFDRLLARAFQKGMTCEQAKEKGMTPEVRLGHAPLKLFGYPVFIEGQTILTRRLPLNKINGFNIPIKVGAEDYVIQGKPSTILKFLDCFSEYMVIGETLFADGHWSAEAKGDEVPRPVYLQVQGAMQGGSVAEILIRSALTKVVKSIDFSLKKQGALSSLVESALRGDLQAEDFLEKATTTNIPLLNDLANYANLGQSVFVEMVQEMNEAQGFDGKLEVFLKYIRGPEDDPEGWQQVKAVQRQSRVTLTVTVYPRPHHDVRSTYKMPSNKVTLQEIKEAFELINFKN